MIEKMTNNTGRRSATTRPLTVGMVIMKQWQFGLVLAALAAVSFGAAPPPSVHAQPRLQLTQGVIEPIPIAIQDFAGATTADADLGARISGVIANNLRRSGLFAPLDPAAFIDQTTGTQSIPRFGDWRLIGGQALIQGTVESVLDGAATTSADSDQIRVEFRLWDVQGEQQMIGLALLTPEGNWRRVAHKISDAIYQRITGETGYFDTQIVYVAEEGPLTRRIKRLAIMDQDGAAHRFLTDGGNDVLSPRFSPSTREITYLQYVSDDAPPSVYLFDLDTRRRESLGTFQGMTFAPRFAPDGNQVIMSMSLDGNTEIFSMDLQSRAMTRLTSHPGIDTSPSYAPTGDRVVFESDRGGTQQLYVMPAAGGEPTRITFGRGRYAQPVWSPRGDLIAFTRIFSGRFFIGVIQPNGEGERMISSAYQIESPTWSPNGRVLAFYKSTPVGDSITRQLYSIDLTGFNEQWLTTPVDGSDPAWSPLIP